MATAKNLLFLVQSVVRLAAKRLVSQRGTAMAAVAGLVSSIAVAVSVPLYADAVEYRVQQEEMTRYEARGGWSLRRLPFVFVFRYIGTWNRPLDLAEVADADEYLSGPAVSALGLPKRRLVRYMRTDAFRLVPYNAPSGSSGMTWVAFGFSEGIEDNVTLLAGRLPAAAAPGGTEPVEVLVSEALAGNQRLQVDQLYTARREVESESGPLLQELPFRVVGVWRPTEPEGDYWCCGPQTLDNVLVVPEATFRDRIAAAMSDEVFLAQWYVLLDGTDVRAGDVPGLLRRIGGVRRHLQELLPKSRLDPSPEKRLEHYERAAGELTRSLYAFSVPVVALILAFIGLVVGLATDQRRSEVAVLRSRGATVIQIVGIAVLEGLILGGVGLALGGPVGQAMTALMSKTRSFLDFTAVADLPVRLTLATLRSGAWMIALALLLQGVHALGSARHTVVTYKRDQARALRPAWWQRAGVDLLLLLPAVYGTYVLHQQGGLSIPFGARPDTLGAPISDPLLLWVPALGIYSLALFTVRLLPGLMRLVSWVTAWTRDVGLLLAARHLARSPALYAGPLVLLVFTLSLSAFTASVAETFDRHLLDQAYYRVGADMRVNELGELPRRDASGAADNAEADDGRWRLLPVSEHLKVSGVRAAARVGNYAATLQLDGPPKLGRFIGVDRLEFPHAAYWREDFAGQSLGGLMNLLAASPDAVLVNRDFVESNALRIGDPLRVSVDTFGQRTTVELRLAGTFDLFPTWYPGQGVLIVGNLDYLFEQAGGDFPTAVWLKTDARMTSSQIMEGVWDLRIQVLDWASARDVILAEQVKPERQGLFGLLSVGFIASAFLTVVGFLLTTVYSYRRRFIELGILRAVGLSAGQMTEFLVAEVAFLVVIGGLVGTLLGVGVSDLYIPFLQSGAVDAASVPPFQVEISWTAIVRLYAVFGLLIAGSLALLAALLMRIQVFQAIKLGETA